MASSVDPEPESELELEPELPPFEDPPELPPELLFDVPFFDVLEPDAVPFEEVLELLVEPFELPPDRAFAGSYFPLSSRAANMALHSAVWGVSEQLGFSRLA